MDQTAPLKQLDLVLLCVTRQFCPNIYRTSMIVLAHKIRLECIWWNFNTFCVIYSVPWFSVPCRNSESSSRILQNEAPPKWDLPYSKSVFKTRNTILKEWTHWRRAAIKNARKWHTLSLNVLLFTMKFTCKAIKGLPNQTTLTLIRTVWCGFCTVCSGITIQYSQL